MARSNTLTKSAVVTQEALSDTSSAELAVTVAHDVVVILGGYDKATADYGFQQSRVMFAGHASGASDADVAAEIMRQRVAAGKSADVSIADGGAKISRVAVTQRRSAWSDVLAAGITPVADVVASAYALTSSNQKGAAELRKALIEDTKELPKAKRAKFYMEEASARHSALKASNKAGSTRSESSAEASADDKAEDNREEVILDSAADVILYLRAVSSRTWSDDDKANLVAAFTEAAARLS